MQLAVLLKAFTSYLDITMVALKKTPNNQTYEENIRSLWKNIDKLLIVDVPQLFLAHEVTILNYETAEIIFLKFHLSLMHENLC